MTARALLREEAQKILDYRRLDAAMKSTTGAVVWRDPKMRPIAWQLELGDVCDNLVMSLRQRTGSRLLLSAPPRHGKTEYIGRGMPVFAMLSSKEPVNVFYVTSSRDRAVEVSWNARRSIEKIYEQTRDRRYAPGKNWTTTSWTTEGGHSWEGMGWSATTGGIGCNMLIMDDLIGSSEIYRSASARASIQRVLREDLMSRIMNGGVAVHMETRRGTLDTTAWLAENYGSVWNSVVWKCYEEGRGYLWPENYGETWRKTMPHLTDDSPIWRSLYQQEPVEEGGTLLPMDWLLPYYVETPEICAQKADRVVIGADLAATGKTKSDPACFVVMAVRGAYRDILHVINRRCDYVEQRQILRDLCKTWRPNAIVVERAAGGDAMISELQREVAGLRGESAVGDKVSRLMPHLGRFAALQVRTPKNAQWVGSWREELSSFTGTPGRLDNQLDATVWALVAAETPQQINAWKVAKAMGLT